MPKSRSKPTREASKRAAFVAFATRASIACRSACSRSGTSELRKLGRIHTAAEAKTALDIARATFERFSFDLIYARPGQTLEDWRAELAEALDLAGDHVSLYQLTIEPDTPYAALHAAGKLVIPDNDAARALYEITGELTDARGLAAYEVSNYARPGSESRHNLLYWRYGEYAGIGPGAHGRIVADGRRRATVAERNPETWAARVEATGSGNVDMIELARAEQADEMLLMGLRLSEGIDLGRLRVARRRATRSGRSSTNWSDWACCRFRTLKVSTTLSQRTGVRTSSKPLSPAPGRACRPGVSKPQSRAVRIRATPSGRLVLNAVVAKLAKSFEASRGMDNLVSAR